MVPQSGATDLGGLVADVKDVEWDFNGSDVKTVDDKVIGVAIVDGTHIKVYKDQKFAGTPVVAFDLLDDNGKLVGNIANVQSTADADDKNAVDLTLPTPVLTGKKYQVTISGLDPYMFDGDVDDAGITIERTNATSSSAIKFSGVDDGYTVSVYKMNADGTPAAIALTTATNYDATNAAYTTNADLWTDGNTYMVVISKDGIVKYANVVDCIDR